jgi:hypothetical protein
LWAVASADVFAEVAGLEPVAERPVYRIGVERIAEVRIEVD